MIYNPTISSAQYVTDMDGNNVTVKATIDGTECFVPMSSGNTDYQAILAWVAEGNTIADAD